MQPLWRMRRPPPSASLTGVQCQWASLVSGAAGLALALVLLAGGHARRPFEGPRPSAARAGREGRQLTRVGAGLREAAALLDLGPEDREEVHADHVLIWATASHLQTLADAGVPCPAGLSRTAAPGPFPGFPAPRGRRRE